MKLHKADHVRGEITVPGDKSISHRSIMFGALAKGTTEITHFLHGADCLSTIGCFRAMGINIEDTPDRILVHGKGLHGLSEPSSFLDVVFLIDFFTGNGSSSSSNTCTSDNG